MHISIISSSVRTGRNSHRVALFFKNYIEQTKTGTAEVLDLKEYNFPLFSERLKHLSDPPAAVKEFAEKIKKSDGIIIVTPEYNGGYPASLKNVVDLLYDEWRRKPIGISTVSDGVFGGSQVITSLVFSLWKIKAWVVPTQCPMPNVLKAFDEQGNPSDKEAVDKRVTPFIQELVWCMEAKKRMET